MATTAQPIGLLKLNGRTHMRVQMQFDRHGDRASEVAAWIDGRYQHVSARVDATPGLSISVQLPGAGADGFETWHAKLVAEIAPMDLALELVCECLEDLALEPAELVSLHLTA